MTDISLKELDDLVDEVRALHADKVRAETEFEAVKKDYNRKARELMNILEDSGRKTVDNNSGRITVVKRHYFKIEDEEPVSYTHLTLPTTPYV